MAAKKFVHVKVDVKDKSVKCLKPDGIIKAATLAIANAINNKSKGTMTTKDKSDQGFLLTANIVTLKGDNPDKPTKLDAKIALIVMTIGTKTQAFTGTAAGNISGAAADPQGSAEDLVSSVLESFMPKAINTMLSFDK